MYSFPNLYIRGAPPSLPTRGEELVSFEDTTAIFKTNTFPQAFRRYAHLIDLNEPFVLRGRVTDDHGCGTLNVTYVDTRLFL